MYPAISVIFFTVMSGAGFGMLALIGLDLPLGFQLPNETGQVFVLSFIAVGFCVAGLISSTFHLGRPERAWRAFSQWRSSWLSREGIASVATLMLYGIYALYWMIEGERLAWLGIIFGLLAIYTVFTTSMIYTQMKTVPHWNTRLTPAVYLSFSLSSGLLLLAGFGRSESLAIGLVILALLAAWGIKLLWWQNAQNNQFNSTNNDRSTVASATGLGTIGQVRLLDRPHTGPNYLTKEMVHVIGRKHARKLRIIALIIGGLVPLAVALLAWSGILPTMTLFFAALIMMLGLFAERWLFFAEAEHSVSLFY